MQKRRFAVISCVLSAACGSAEPDLGHETAPLVCPDSNAPASNRDFYDRSSRALSQITHCGNGSCAQVLEQRFEDDVLTETIQQSAKQRFHYSSGGFLTQVDHESGGAECYRYDDVGRLIELSSTGDGYDRDGGEIDPSTFETVIAYSYDAEGRLSEKLSIYRGATNRDDANREVYGYDSESRLTARTLSTLRADGTIVDGPSIRLVRDETRRLVRIDTQVADHVIESDELTYDEHGRWVGLKRGGRTVQELRYDEHGLVSHIDFIDAEGHPSVVVFGHHQSAPNPFSTPWFPEPKALDEEQGRVDDGVVRFMGL